MQPDPTTLEALADRVEAGEYGWQINAEVLVAVGEYRWENEAEKNSHNPRLLVCVEDGRYVFDHQLPPISTSLDAIEAARVRLLPGSLPPEIIWGDATPSNAPTCRAYQAIGPRGWEGHSARTWDGLSTTERHARLSALLRAVAAKVRAEGGKG